MIVCQHYHNTHRSSQGSCLPGKAGGKEGRREGKGREVREEGRKGEGRIHYTSFGLPFLRSKLVLVLRYSLTSFLFHYYFIILLLFLFGAGSALYLANSITIYFTEETLLIYKGYSVFHYITHQVYCKKKKNIKLLFSIISLQHTVTSSINP